MAGTLTIRRATTNDAAAFSRIMGDPSVVPGTMQMPYANEERHRGWLADLNAAGKGDILLLAERDGEAVGSAGLHPAAPSLRRRHAVYLGISIVGKAQGQGVGTALMASLCAYADRWLGALRIELTVFADNAPAIALYRKFGFVDEGRMRGYALRGGEYADALAMARFHPHPPSISSGIAP